jgi:signal transduction histidine kinase
MQNVVPVARVVLATLCAVELASVVSRLRWREARREAVWLAALLAAYGARLLVPRGSPADFLVPVAVAAFTSTLLRQIHRRRGTLPWTIAAAAVAALLLLLAAGGVPVAVMRAVGAAAIAALCIPPVVLLVLLHRKTGEPADLFILALAAAWGTACCVETAGALPAGASDALIAPLLALIGFMLFEQGYLSPLTSSGYVDRLAAERRLMRRTYARLLESRNALVLQDRLIAAGLLALGAAHEFKDVLSAVRLAAAHGRSAECTSSKDRCLDLVMEHAAAGGASAAEFLERLGREGREEPTRLAVHELVDSLVRIARPSWRPAGISLVVQHDGDFSVLARRREIEQVLLNLLRNAVDAIESAGSVDREVRVSTSRAESQVEISVSDTAGGVPDELSHDLFTLGRSGTGSTGIGLYLARDLTVRNGGSLSYTPIPHGSRFSVSLPTA